VCPVHLGQSLSYKAPPHRCSGRGHGPRRSPLDRPQFTQGKGCNNRKLSDADRVEIVRLYTTQLPDGTWMGATAIARLFGVRHPVVYRELERAGVSTRSMSEAHRGKACRPIKNLPIGAAPECRCGCGVITDWNRRKNRWNRYVAGHYTRRLEQAPTWQGGRSFEPYAIGWPSISKAIRERDGHTCQTCGATERLHVHHIDTNKLNNDPSNLVTLCNRCHGLAHAALRGGGA